MIRRTLVAALHVAFLAGLAGACAREERALERRFATPEDAVRALDEIVKAGKLDDLIAFFGPESESLVSSSDPETGRRNRQVFVAAMRERWRLDDRGPDAKELVIGNEDWPFPIPLVKDAAGWTFDVEAGKEEVLSRRIGRNELAAMGVCRTYVTAQRAYASAGRGGKRAGLYARQFNSDPGARNGLYWPAERGQPRSPLGELVAGAAEDGHDLASRRQPAPFHGYYFRILTAQGASAPGGARDYLSGGDLSGGFALVAWPAQYDTTGIMTFIVNGEGVVYEKDLGPDTAKIAAAMSAYDPDATWVKAE